MNATELYQAGKLQEAIDAQIQLVKAKPADQALRLFLFELFAFAGELDRALKQFDVLKFEEMGLVTAAANYRNLIESEKLRRRVFNEGIAPTFLKEPPEYVKLRVEALGQLRANNHVAAKELIDRSDAAIPPYKGTLNEKPIELLRDCDDLFGPILEVMAQGKYLWIALEEVEMIAKNAPKYPRDLIWAPAQLQPREGGGLAEVFLPVLYPNSHLNLDTQIKLGRANDWQQSEGGPVRGVGHRTFLFNDDAINLLDWRQLQGES